MANAKVNATRWRSATRVHPKESPTGPTLRPLLANNGLSGHVAGTSALPPTTDIRAPMSALTLFRPLHPPRADLPGGVAEANDLAQALGRFALAQAGFVVGGLNQGPGAGRGIIAVE